MKKSSIILLVSALILVAGLAVAGCVSDSGTSQSVTTTASESQGTPPDMQAGNMTGQPPRDMAAGNMTDRPSQDMQRGNMTGEPPEMPGNMTGGPQPGEVPPSETASS